MIDEFEKAVNANVYMFASWKAREVYYKNIERSKPKTLSWFNKHYGIEFCIFEQLQGKGRQKACIRCNNSFLRLRKNGGDWVYDDELDDDELDYGMIYPVW